MRQLLIAALNIALSVIAGGLLIWVVKLMVK
jgi:hypothetical protein